MHSILFSFIRIWAFKLRNWGFNKQQNKKKLMIYCIHQLFENSYFSFIIVANYFYRDDLQQVVDGLIKVHFIIIFIIKPNSYIYIYISFKNNWKLMIELVSIWFWFKLHVLKRFINTFNNRAVIIKKRRSN